PSRYNSPWLTIGSSAKISDGIHIKKTIDGVLLTQITQLRLTQYRFRSGNRLGYNFRRCSIP
ncbi:MAG TPA: hypothetical protein VF089_20165, partial [Candidatus Binatia bacterium]